MGSIRSKCTAPHCRCIGPCDAWYYDDCNVCGEESDDCSPEGFCPACQANEDTSLYDDELAERLRANGYTFSDGEFWKTVSNKVRTARRNHSDNYVRKGDSYREVVTRTVYYDGSSYMKRGKFIVRRAS